MATGLRGAGDSSPPALHRQEDVTKIQELMYELLVQEIMTSPVITVSDTAPMEKAREMMRTRRISGLPVMRGSDLAGIVSVEDVFRWLEVGAPESSTSEWMTAKVHTVCSTDAAAKAINKFSAYKVGRLPVLDPRGKLVGIVTPGDVIDRVLRVLDELYREQEPLRPVTHCALKGLLSDGTGVVLRYDVRSGDLQKAGTAATTIKRILQCFGLDPQVVRRAGTAAYEAEMNLAIHTGAGGRIMAHIARDRVVIQASDDGPGIANIDRALTPGFSTAPEWIRELGFGAGMGLSNMRNCADHFSIKSSLGKGTVVRVAIDLNGKDGRTRAAREKTPRAGRERSDLGRSDR